MCVLMVGTRGLVQKQHSEGESHELIVFYARCSVTDVSASGTWLQLSTNLLRFSWFDGAVYVMIFLVGFLCGASLAHALCW